MKKSTIFWIALLSLLIIVFTPWWISAIVFLVVGAIVNIIWCDEDERENLKGIEKLILLYWIVRGVTGINKLIDGN